MGPFHSFCWIQGSSFLVLRYQDHFGLRVKKRNTKQHHAYPAMSRLQTAAFIFCLLFHISACAPHQGSRRTVDAQLVRMKEEPNFAITPALIAAGITAGASLTGTTVSALMAPGYSVAVSGSIENYTEWPMIFQYCNADAGKINKAMVDVQPGKEEGFASHKTANTATGSYVYCLYKVNNKRVHIMYSAPYSFDLHSNWLALALTASTVRLNADKMYYEDFSFMAKREYDDMVRPARICREGLCISGIMGTSHKSIVTIKLYPRSFGNLSPSVKKSLKDMGVENETLKYDKFIMDEFHGF